MSDVKGHELALSDQDGMDFSEQSRSTGTHMNCLNIKTPAGRVKKIKHEACVFKTICRKRLPRKNDAGIILSDIPGKDNNGKERGLIFLQSLEYNDSLKLL